MKICQIVASSGLGGLEKHVVELANALAKSEEVTVVAPQDMAPFFAAPVRFVPFDFSRSRYNPLMLWDLLKVIERGDFDIVHAQANKAVSLLSKLRRFVPAKTLGTIHNCNKNKGRAFKNLDHVIAVSEAAGRLIDRRIPVTVVYNGIRLPDEIPVTDKRELIAEFGLPDDRPLLCSIGRLVPAKGFDLLIDAIETVDASLLIVGAGPLQPDLQARIDELKLSHRVKLTGHRRDVPRIIAGCEGVVIASRYEGFSYVFAEAVLLGKPVLATDVPVANEVLDKDLIMPIDSDAIRDKLIGCLCDSEFWRKKMEPVWRLARDRFELGVMADNTLAVYRKVLRQS
ncbi:MAG: glycosyltransferase family 1 protein [Methylomicrobium sp.]